MANLYRSLRGGTPCCLSMWIVLVQCLFNLMTLPADCRGASDNPVTIYPSTYIYVNYSDPLEIFCVDETSSSINLEFSVGTNVIPSEIVNATTRRLYVEKLKKQVITYTCKNNNTANNRFTRVLVDSPPINVTDFTCRSENLEVLNCTWSTPQNYSVYNYTLTFLIYGNPVNNCHVQEIGHLKFSCAWNTYTRPRYHQMEKIYIFKLTSCNVFGCNIQLITVDHFSIVKPKPPKDLVVVYNHTHSVLLQWKKDINLHLLPDGVDHRIEYQIAKIDNVTYFRSVDASSLPSNNRTYKFLLSELPYAHMQYEVRIYIRCKTASNNAPWSDFTYTIIYTASERPNRPPDTIVGAFGQTLFDAKRMIYVYWKQLEEYEEAGENFTYKVVASPHKNNYQTIIADKSKSLSYVLLDNATLDAIDISIWSMNEKGSSFNSSYLYIPPETATKQPKVTSFTKLAYENGTYKLAWSEVSDIDNYTIFWCIHNTTEVCVGRMDFAVIEPDRTSYVLDLPKDNRYQFAISANNGKNTSGMVWAICEIFQDTIQLYRFPMKMDRDAAGPSFVPLKWKTDCILQHGAINGYQISYCPVLATSDVCASKDVKSFKTISINDPNQMSINITKLEPYTTYLFTLAINTSSGLKTLDNVSATTIEDTPTSPVNITICEIGHNSMNVSWDPPNHKNGIIGRYVIKNNNMIIFEFKVPENDKDVSRRVVNITGLSGFTNYSLTVQACNNAIMSCSKVKPNDAIFVRTRIGPPAKLKTPTLGPNTVSWEPPDKPGGIVSLYQLQRVKDGNNHEEIFNTTNLEFQLVQCDGGVSAETYRVRAVNFDEDEHYGAFSNRKEVYLPQRNGTSLLEYTGEWSDGARIACGGKDGLLMTFILMAVFALMGLMYSTIKCYKKYRKMEDIKPVLPNGLGIPEKDIAKYSFGGWNPANKDEKPSSDEMLLLPNSRTTVSTSELKQKENNNCASSDHTDSTVLSDTSHAPVDRQVSTTDDGSDSSLHLEVEAARIEDKDINQEYEYLSSSDTEISQNALPYYGENVFNKSSGSGYVQQPVNSGSGYVQSAPFTIKSPPSNLAAPNANSSYVMASLSTPIFTTGVPQPNTSHTPAASGYVRPEDAQRQVGLNVPKQGPPQTRLFGPESLPTMPTLPSPAKLGADNSYIQLQSLDTLPSHKQPVHNTVPLKSQTSSGYVSPGDAVMNKHLNNMLSGGQIAEESVILDPTMSPDAYCRFSWSTDPANDNLHSLLADSPGINSSNK